MYDLNDLAVNLADSGFTSLTEARAINDSGWIVGWGETATGQQRAFLAQPVPEPADLGLFFVGALGLAAVRRRKALSDRTGVDRICENC
jgi:probable HAF family extracellular repeat protein